MADGLFGGAMTHESEREAARSQESGALFSTEPPGARDASLTALTYHLWATRTPGSMQVWVAEPKRQFAGLDDERIKGIGQLGAVVAGNRNGDMTTRNAILASIGVALVFVLASPPASAQSNPPPGAAAAAAIPRTGAGAGSSAARTRHRNTLNRQRARATSEHARHVRRSPHH